MIALRIFLVLLDISVFTGCAVMMVRMLPEKVEGCKREKIIAWGVFALLSILLPNFGGNDILTMVILIPCYMGVGWFFYHRSKTGLLYQLIYMVAMYAVQVIAIFCTIHLSSSFNLEATTGAYIMTLMKDVFLFLTTIILGAILNRRYVEDRHSLKMRGMILVPMFSMALIFISIISGEVFFARYGYGFLIVFCVMVMVINFYCLYFWYDVAANQELKHKVEMMQKENALTHQYYRDLEENYNQSRKIIHDIRNHMYAMEQASRMEKTQDYFSDVHEMLNSLGMKFYSDNRMLNIVLNDKLKALSDDQVECSLGGVHLGFLSDMDITTIFANLLDNAVEAGEGRQDFWLRIRGEQIQDFTIVKIWNSCCERDGQTKKGKHEGLGLENVKQALKKYHGELEVTREENIFSVTLVFPGQEFHTLQKAMEP